MGMDKVYCCVPTYLQSDEKIRYEIEAVKNYYMASFSNSGDKIEFVTNYIEDRKSDDYSLSDSERKAALFEELGEAIKRLKDCKMVVFYPRVDAETKVIEELCSSYECNTRIWKMSR